MRVPVSLRSILLAILIIAGAASIFFYILKNKPAVPAEPFQKKAWAVSTYSLSITDAAPEVVLYGAIEASEKVQLSATVNAFVDTVFVSKGDNVSKGDTLVVLDDRDVKITLAQRQASIKDIQARITSEKNRFELANNSYTVEKQLQALNVKSLERQKVLVKNNMAPASRLEDAERVVHQQQISLLSRENQLKDHPNTLAQLQAQAIQSDSMLRLAKLDLERTKISAPFTGRILSVNTAMGNLARNGDRLITMYNSEKLEVRSQIPTKYLSILRNNPNIVAKVNYNGNTIPLALDRLSAEATASQGGVDAYFSFPTTANIEIGRNIELTIALPLVKNVAAIPALSLYGQNTVYRVTEQRLEAVAVERIGEVRSDQGTPLTLIRGADLQQGDQIITTQLPNAITGLFVETR